MDNRASGNTSPPGAQPDPADPRQLIAALDKAFDYRGDVTLSLRDGRTLEGYIFDRRTGQGLDDSMVRLIPKGRDDRLEVRYADITGVAFTGRDTAEGKSWQRWVENYLQKRQAGQSASIESDPVQE